MPELLATQYIIQNTSFGVVQRIAQGSNFTGELPGTVTADFVPVFDSTTGVIHYKDAVGGTGVEGTRGGLYSFGQDTPVEISQILADFGASVTWTVSILTADDYAIPVATNTGRYISQLPPQRLLLQPGDRLKVVTTGGAAAMWLRVSIRTEQAVD